MFDLSDKCALITGASGGIGGDIARTLHARGAVLTVSGTREPALAELAGALGERVHVMACDLDDKEATAALAKDAEAAMGQIDILVNNAGLTRDSLSLRLSDDDWQKVIDTDLTAAFRLSRAVLRGMARRRWGRLINITSIVGLTGNPGQANYAAAKAGLIGMSKAMAQEVASRGTTINCVAPGFIASPMTEALADAQRDRLLGAIPAGRLGAGTDVAACVAFLASEEAAYITGQTLHVNGGMAMF